MKRFLGAAFVTACVAGLSSPAPADGQEAKVVLDKAIKAVGGEEKLAKVGAFTWKGKGTITFGDDTNEFSGRWTAQGLDRFRAEFDGNFGGNPIRGVTVLDRDKGWRKFGDNVMEMDADAIANEKRNFYLQIVPVLLVPLKGTGFKVESAAEEKIGGKPASVIKATGPDGKDFTLYFDKESGLPVRQVAKVVGFQGEEITQETTSADYKEFDGIKKATKVESKRDGDRFVEQQITEFKVVDKVDPETFTEPK